jgi:hypothetical protein
VQLDQLIQPLQTRCPSAFGAEYRLRVSAISIYCRTEGNCDGSSGTPTGTEGRHRPSGARPRKVGKRSNPFVRVRWCGCLISVRLDRCCRRGRMTGCHPERPVVVSRANRSRRPQAVIQVSLKNGPVMCRVSDTGPINDLSAGTEGPVSESLQGRNPRGLAGGSRSMGI